MEMKVQFLLLFWITAISCNVIQGKRTFEITLLELNEMRIFKPFER